MKESKRLFPNCSFHFGLQVNSFFDLSPPT